MLPRGATVEAMGRAGIRRRKPKRSRLRLEEDTGGILDDLYDQAEWSSYGSHIPRPGNPARDRIWWRRGFRAWGNALGGYPRGEDDDDPGWFTVLASATILIVAGLAVIFGVFALVGWLFR